MKFSPKNDMRAIVHMIYNSLRLSERPVHHEMAFMLKEASCEWLEKIEALEKDHLEIMSLIKNLENNSAINKSVLTGDEADKLEKIIYEH